MRSSTTIVMAMAGVICAASPAIADLQTLDLDIDIVEGRTFASDGVTPDVFDATTPGPSGFSGVVRLSETVDTTLFEVRINGATFSQTAGELTSDVATLTGELTLENGMVKGGFFEVILDSNDAYVTTVIPDTGFLVVEFDGTGTIDGLTMSGIFTTTTGEFAGAPLGDFDTGGLFGSFLNITLDPQAVFDPITGDVTAFVDSQADLTLSAVIPLPTAAGLGLAGLSLLGLRRRRMTV